ncbi:lysozyme inhibitor LprI family protein [Ramlibacter humi]|uniref:DUF1311 domain-containing protein n=1 Tax=Ramlibacter humi TaxID=2530451 RepID=A0A4Z0BJA0_9BURK|nr:DUF1311 domain-containing protein [Ramlibacter humi]
MRHLFGFCAAIAILAVSRPAHALDCGALTKDDEILACVGDQLADADRELNATYVKLRANTSKESLELLTKAQRLWMSLRDADCEVEAGNYRGGSAYNSIYVACQRDKTRQRTLELKHFSQWPRR